MKTEVVFNKCSEIIITLFSSVKIEMEKKTFPLYQGDLLPPRFEVQIG